MKLTISERLMLLGVLPKEENFLSLKIIRDLKSALSFTEKETKKFGTVYKRTVNYTNTPEKNSVHFSNDCSLCVLTKNKPDYYSYGNLVFGEKDIENWETLPLSWGIN